MTAQETGGDHLSIYNIENQTSLTNSDPAWMVDDSASILLDVNQAALNLLGYQRSEIMGMSLDQLCPPELNPERKHLQTKLDTTRLYSCELFVRKASGDICVLTATYRLIPSETSNRLMVTLKSKYQFDNGFLFKMITSHLPAIIWMLEIKTAEEVSCVYMSDATLELQGIKSEAFYKNPRALYALTHPEDLPHVTRAHQRALREKTGWNIEFRMRHAITGEWRRFNSHSRVTARDDGSFFLCGYTIDTTESHAVHDALQHNQERLRLAESYASFGIWEIDFVQDKVIWDEQMYKIYDYPLGKPLTMHQWQGMFLFDDRSEISRVTPDSLGNKVFNLRRQLLHPDGSLRHIEGQGRILYDAQNKPVRAIGINRDITEMVLAEEELRNSREELENANKQLSERVKELTLLHKVSRLLQTKSNFSSQLFIELVEQIPFGWRYSDRCAARICWGEYGASSANWQDSPWKLSIEFEAGNQAGSIDVIYVSKPPGQSGEWFMPEERALIDSVSEMLRLYLEQHLAMQAMREHQTRIAAQNRSLFEIAWKQSHEVRRPLANMMGLVALLREPEHASDLIGLLENEALALDQIIREIVDSSQEVLQSVKLPLSGDFSTRSESKASFQT